MRDLQATEDEIRECLGSLMPDDHFDVFPENWEALNWFLQVDREWKLDPVLGYSLNLQAVQADAQLSGRQVDPDDYRKLLDIASTAAEELNKSLRR